MCNVHLRRVVFLFFIMQLLYFCFHLQFLFGLPQAGLSVRDSLYFYFLGLSVILFAKNYWEFFSVCALILWPTIELQYLSVHFFNKPFILQELTKFPDLVIVSSPFYKFIYIFAFFLWTISILFFIGVFVMRWLHFTMQQKLISVLTIALTISIFMFKPSQKSIDWIGESTRELFFFRGIIVPIHARNMFSQEGDFFSYTEVKEAFEYLKKKESQRKIYPVSQSPLEVPSKKRPIFLFIFESFYDFKHFIPLFDKDPIPKEYREWTSHKTYTGPHQTYGSFEARFVSLCGAIPLKPLLRKDSSFSIASILSSYGYKTIALEAMGPTYNLHKYYKQWGFSEICFNVYGREDWKGNLQQPNTYEQNFLKYLNSFSETETPFCFGFTYLGHTGSFAFTDKLAPLEHLDNFLKLFPEKDRFLLQKLIKSAVFNAKRLISMRNAILKKYPDALIIFKADHYTPELGIIMEKENKQFNIVKEAFRKDPFPMPFLVFDGVKGILDLPEYFSPANIPLLIMAEARLPYQNTIPSLFFRNPPENVRFFYDDIYLFNEEVDAYQLLQNLDKKELLEYRKFLNILSKDLYHNKDIPHIFSFLTKQ